MPSREPGACLLVLSRLEERPPDLLAPTLLIVDGRDDAVIQLNEAAFAQLQCEKVLQIVPSATHLFEEPYALEAVARLATTWFQRHLQS